MMYTSDNERIKLKHIYKKKLKSLYYVSHYWLCPQSVDLMAAVLEDPNPSLGRLSNGAALGIRIVLLSDDGFQLQCCSELIH